ncbi:hypothetical protein BC829DRAFT_491371 [Chytridium lagenaria]|nr:hypothetical protein BC829DRAFT_491371 [Chytridium lagenaria]
MHHYSNGGGGTGGGVGGTHVNTIALLHASRAFNRNATSSTLPFPSHLSQDPWTSKKPPNSSIKHYVIVDYIASPPPHPYPHQSHRAGFIAPPPFDIEQMMLPQKPLRCINHIMECFNHLSAPTCSSHLLFPTTIKASALPPLSALTKKWPIISPSLPPLILIHPDPHNIIINLLPPAILTRTHPINNITKFISYLDTISSSSPENEMTALLADHLLDSTMYQQPGLAHGQNAGQATLPQGSVSPADCLSPAASVKMGEDLGMKKQSFGPLRDSADEKEVLEKIKSERRKWCPQTLVRDMSAIKIPTPSPPPFTTPSPTLHSLQSPPDSTGSTSSAPVASARLNNRKAVMAANAVAAAAAAMRKAAMENQAAGKGKGVVRASEYCEWRWRISTKVPVLSGLDGISNSVRSEQKLPIGRLPLKTPIQTDASLSTHPLQTPLNSNAKLPTTHRTRYRNNINQRISDLRAVVPALNSAKIKDGRRGGGKGAAMDDDSDGEGGDDQSDIIDGIPAATKLNKATILRKATEYIVYLRAEEEEREGEVYGRRGHRLGLRPLCRRHRREVLRGGWRSMRRTWVEEKPEAGWGGEDDGDDVYDGGTVYMPMPFEGGGWEVGLEVGGLLGRVEMGRSMGGGYGSRVGGSVPWESVMGGVASVFASFGSSSRSCCRVRYHQHSLFLSTSPAPRPHRFTASSTPQTDAELFQPLKRPRNRFGVVGVYCGAEGVFERDIGDGEGEDLGWCGGAAVAFIGGRRRWNGECAVAGLRCWIGGLSRVRVGVPNSDKVILAILIIALGTSTIHVFRILSTWAFTPTSTIAYYLPFVSSFPTASSILKSLSSHLWRCGVEDAREGAKGGKTLNIVDKPGVVEFMDGFDGVGIDVEVVRGVVAGLAFPFGVRRGSVRAWKGVGGGCWGDACAGVMAIARMALFAAWKGREGEWGMAVEAVKAVDGMLRSVGGEVQGGYVELGVEFAALSCGGIEGLEGELVGVARRVLGRMRRIVGGFGGLRDGGGGVLGVLLWIV